MCGRFVPIGCRLSTGKQPVARGRILLVGDAASLVNPVSGEGIYYAIRSSLDAGRAAVRDPARAASHYRTAMRRQFGTHHVHADVMSRLIRWDAVLHAGLLAARNSQRGLRRPRAALPGYRTDHPVVGGTDVSAPAERGQSTRRVQRGPRARVRTRLPTRMRPAAPAAGAATRPRYR